MNDAGVLKELEEALPAAPPKSRFKPYPAYKDSGIDWLGDVPEHWETLRLKDWVSSIVDKRSYNQTCPVIDLENVESGIGRLIENMQLVELTNNTDKLCFTSTSVLYGKLRPYLRKALRPGFNGYASPEFFVLLPKLPAYTAFLYYLALSHPFNELANSAAYGTKMPRCSWDKLGSEKFPLPPLREIGAIASFLDWETGKIDALIAKKQRLIELLKEKRTALITHAVTKGLNPSAPMKDSGIEWLGQVPADWTQMSFRWCCRIPSGQVDPKEKEFAQLPLIAPDHISSGSGHLQQYETAEEQGAISGKYIFEKGTVIYSKIRPELAKVCIAPESGLCSADMYPLVPQNKLTASFLFYQILSRHFTQLAILVSGRVAMPKVNRDTLGSFPMLIPRACEQREIVSFLEGEVTKLDALNLKVEAHIEKLREFRAALITAAVTGKIDVRDAA